jgi:hypothetical protein
VAVLATKTLFGFPVQRYFECGQFDLLQENGGGWTELWRDCDVWTAQRRTLWPFASGPKGTANAVVVSIADTRTRFRKYFPALADEEYKSALDLSDVNSGLLPIDYCVWMEVQQNGKCLPCEAFSVNFALATVNIEAEWQVPGASYEVKFFATPAP